MEWLLLPPLLLPFAGVVLTLLTRKRRPLQAGLALGVMTLAFLSTVVLTGIVLSNRKGVVLQVVCQELCKS